MVNNEPLYARKKALTMKLYRAVEGKKMHLKMVKHFNRMANLQKALIQENDCIIMLNQTDCFASFWRLVE